MADVTQEEISKLKPGRYVIIDGAACTLSSMQRSAPGKHGHAKYRVEAKDMITGNKKIIIMTGHSKIDVPIIEKKNAQVLSISGNTAQLMDMESYETFDADIPSELKGKIVAGATVVFWAILGKKLIKQVK